MKNGKERRDEKKNKNVKERQNRKERPNGKQKICGHGELFQLVSIVTRFWGSTFDN